MYVYVFRKLYMGKFKNIYGESDEVASFKVTGVLDNGKC